MVEQIAQKYSLRLLLLFGSRVKGQIHRESDYDIGYLSAQPLDLESEGRLIADLLPLVGERDERLINLVNIKKASPLLLYGMTARCRVLYEKEPALFARLRAYGFKQYLEMKPLYEEQARRIRTRLLAQK